MRNPQGDTREAGTSDPTQASTIPELVRAMGDAYGDKAAVVLGDDVLTYRALQERSAVLARGLLARGVGKGARVGILFANNPEWVVAWAAVARIGAVAVPLSTFLKPPELAKTVRHGDLCGVIAQREMLRQDFVGGFAAAFPDLASTSTTSLRLQGAPYLRWIAFTGDGDLPAWAHDQAWIETGAEGFDDAMLAAAEAEVFHEDAAMMIYTSGQSALPKGVLHSQGTIVGKAHYLRNMLNVGPESQRPAAMPFFWVGGLVMTLFTTMEIGGTVLCAEGPSAVRMAIGVGQPSKEQVQAQQGRKWVGLGMSETFGIYSWGSEPPDLERSAWCPRIDSFEPGYDVKVVDPSGERVGDGERGEIMVRGPSVTLGIQKVDRTTVFDADGFYHTGDEGEVDGDGIYFTARLGDMIKTSGANVAPAEVELELLELDGVANAYVVAIDDVDRGQLVGAAVIPEDGVALDRAAMLDTLKGRLSSYKVPRLLVVIGADDVPLGASSKVVRQDLAALIRTRADLEHLEPEPESDE